MYVIRPRYFILYLPLILLANTVFGQTRAQDSLSLRSFYTATEGGQWLDDNNWNIGPLDYWYGISLENNLVWDVILPGNNLTGSITSSDFPIDHALGTVNLSDNHIDNIPDSINAESLNVGGNSLTFEDLYSYKGDTAFRYANQDLSLIYTS